MYAPESSSKACASTLSTVAAASPDGADRYQAVPTEGGVRVHVTKKGLFSGFAHDHDFEVTRWRASAEIPGGDPARASIEVVLEAASLRDRDIDLSALLPGGFLILPGIEALAGFQHHDLAPAFLQHCLAPGCDGGVLALPELRRRPP